MEMEIAIVNFDAGIYLYQDSALFFKRTLEADNNITHLGCNKALNRCTNIMSLSRKIDELWLSVNKEFICSRCKKEQELLVDEFSFSIDQKLDALNPAQNIIIKDLAVKNSKYTSAYLAVEYDNAPLGRLAFYDFAMLNKLSHATSLSTNQVYDFLEHLKDAFFVWNFMNRVLANKSFNAALYNNGNYSLNAIARERLKRNGVKCWSIEYTWANSTMEKRVYLEEDRLIHGREWPSLSAAIDNFQWDYNDTLTAINGFRNRIYGVDFNSYSSFIRTESWRNFDEFKSNYNELISIFVSSGDELLTHETVYNFKQDKKYFKNQNEWILFLIKNVNLKVGYVIRLHPRLKPNKRDSIQAEEYFRLLETIDIARALPNIMIIEADDTISSYYILLHSVLSVVSWSMIALESVVLGIPTVVCFPKNMSFPIEKMGPQPSSLDEIKQYVQRTIIPQRTKKHDIETLKWINIIYSRIGLKIVGVRYPRNRLVRIWSRIIRSILTSNHFFSLLFRTHFKDLVTTSSDGGLHIKPDLKKCNQKDDSKCMNELIKLRYEARASFMVKNVANAKHCVKEKFL
ncbi:MAG: hypothetical protein OEZ01_05115 [Candidatus Heimdallarchaeota archaeon]|nr:hypothetical protein [Candidatus Heimdallarchaeota archaeon]